MPAPDRLVTAVLDIPVFICCILIVGVTVKTKLQIDMHILDQCFVLMFVFLEHGLEEILRNSTTLNLNLPSLHIP